MKFPIQIDSEWPKESNETKLEIIEAKKILKVKNKIICFDRNLFLLKSELGLCEVFHPQDLSKVVSMS